MKFAVFGAGAVGGHIALRLAQSGQDTVLVARGRQLEAIRQRGLTLRTPEGSVTCPIHATDNPRTLGVQDVVVVAVKGTSLGAAVADIRPLIGGRTRILYAMNGVPWWFGEGGDPVLAAGLRRFLDPDGTISSLVPLDRLLWSMVLLGGAVVEPGVIVSSAPGPGSLAIGYPDGRVDAELEAICGALKQAGIDASIETEIRRKIWFKLLMNAGQATVATLCERSAVDTVSDPELRAIVVACMNEILQVGRAIGIGIDADPLAITEPSRHSAHRSSLLQDLQAGRPLELRPTIQAVRYIARFKGVATPHLDTVAALIAARSA
jgi:2-dehydropantoate 2-reductase